LKNLPTALRARLGDEVIEQAIRLGLLAFLIYWSFVLIRPFLPILLWSTVLAVALYPGYAWLTVRLGGHRLPAAVLMTVSSLLVIIGPAMWMALGLIDGLRNIADQLGSGVIPVPAPPDNIKGWPLIGPQAYELWDLASTNLDSALRRIAPQLKPLARPLLGMAGSAGLGVLSFLVSVALAGFLLVPGPRLVEGARTILSHVVPNRSGELVELAGSAIRSTLRGVLGISLLQALLAGIGFKLAGVPGAGMLAFLVLACAIVQLGSTLIVIPVLVWSWTTMDTAAAVVFSIYLLLVNFMDNILKPIVLGHGLRTPMLVIFVGVIGGTLAHGLIGLFVGPVVLAVAWELLTAWMRSEEGDLRQGRAAAGASRASADPQV